MSINTKEIAQIRLLIPKEMVSELDTIASSRDMTRLSTIRFLLRNQIDAELSQLETYLEQVERRRNTHQRLQEHLSDKERW